MREKSLERTEPGGWVMLADWAAPSATPLGLSPNPALPGPIHGPQHGQSVPASSWWPLRGSLFCESLLPSMVPACWRSSQALLLTASPSSFTHLLAGLVQALTAPTLTF